MIIEGVEYITTEIEAWAVGYKFLGSSYVLGAS